MADEPMMTDQMYRAVVENSPDLIIRYDLNCRRTYVNSAWKRLSNIPAEDAVGKTPAELSNILDPSEYQARLLAAAKGVPGEVVAVTDSKRFGRRVHHMRVVPELDADGNVQSILAIGRDFTAMSEAQDLVARFLANVPGFVFSFRMSPDGQFSMPFASHGVEDVLGLSPEDLHQDALLHISSVLHPDDYPRFLEAIKVSSESLESSQLEFRVRHSDSTERWIEARFQPVRESDGGTIWHGFQLDITSRKLAESEARALNAELEQRVLDRTRELDEANKDLEAFNYSVSHDLRSPLRSIEGFNALLREDYADRLDDEGRMYLDKVKSNCDRMEQLISGLLQFARVSRVALSRSSIDLSQIADEISFDLRRSQPNRVVEFVIAPGCRVYAQPDLLKVVMENVLGNAWKYSSKNPNARIEFGVDTSASEPVFFVKDDGAGFDSRYVDNLFKAFKRLHTAAEFPGSGIGLATVQRIVQRHGGKVWIEGDVNQGAKLSFTIPDLGV